MDQFGKTSGRRHESSSFLPEDFSPRPEDIICSRGGISYFHAGNSLLRQAIEDSLDEYQATKSKEKRTAIVSAIINSMSARQGKFVRQDRTSKRWFQVDSRTTREKVGQAIRAAIKKRGGCNEPKLPVAAQRQAKPSKGVQTSSQRQNTKRVESVASLLQDISQARHQFEAGPEVGIAAGLPQTSANPMRINGAPFNRDDGFHKTGVVLNSTPTTFEVMGSSGLPRLNPYQGDAGVNLRNAGNYTNNMCGGINWLERSCPPLSGGDGNGGQLTLQDNRNTFYPGYDSYNSPDLLHSLANERRPFRDSPLRGMPGAFQYQTNVRGARAPSLPQLGYRRSTPPYPLEGSYFSPQSSPER